MFIRGPFVVEAMFHGLVATVITLVLAYPATVWGDQKTIFFFEGMNIHAYYMQHFFELAPSPCFGSYSR